MPFVTTMVLVTTSVRSGRGRRFPLVRYMARAVCRQPKPVGLWSAWHMRNKLRKICTHHRLEDRLHGTTRTNHRGYHTPTRTTEPSPADYPRVYAVGKLLGRKFAWWISKIATNHFNYQPNHNSRGGWIVCDHRKAPFLAAREARWHTARPGGPGGGLCALGVLGIDWPTPGWALRVER